MRVHELAKELGVSSKDLLEKLRMDFSKTASSSLTVSMVKEARAAFAPPAPAPAPAPIAPAPAPAPATPPTPAPAPAAAPPAAPAPAARKVVTISGPIVVREFAEQLGLKPNQLIAELMTMNIFASITQKIDLKIAQKIAERHHAVLEQQKKAPPPPPPPPPKPVEAPKPDIAVKLRPPVVTFMGHVDHGKTSLLDKIRNAKVAAGEAGGITQHIGAYSVTTKDKDGKDRKITFLDTPGHEAFTAMRARGATLTDIVVLVVDGVDGIMPQTKEAAQHAKAAQVTIMVAINKMDLRAANADRVKQSLQQIGLAPEDWGGETVVCPVSAMTGQGVDHLLEMISLQAEVLELKARFGGPATGYVVEAHLAPGMGPAATLLIREGTLKVGDPIVCGPAWGRVKALIDYQGKRVKEAGPSDAVLCLGLSEVPVAGSSFEVYPSDRAAREVAEQRHEERREKNLADLAQPKRAITLEDLMRPASDVAKDKKELSVIVKTDVQGSLEAIQYALTGIKSDKVMLRMILAGIGNITVNDVLLAKASQALIIGFQVSKETEVSAAAKREGVEVRLYSIIYELVDEIRDAMLGLLDPVTRENVHGQAEVRQIFDLDKKGRVAGCIMGPGRVTTKSRVRVKRRGDVVYVGHIGSLRRFQNDAAEVREGQECGIRLDGFNDIQAGDLLEFYDVEKMAQQL